MNVLVTKPKTLSAPDKALLRKHGIVVVEAANPDEVRLLDAVGSKLTANDLLYAALQALAKDTYPSSSHTAFVKCLASLSTASQTSAPHAVSSASQVGA